MASSEGSENNLSYRSPLLGRDGASPLTTDAELAPDAEGVAWHYGDPLVEQRAVDGPGMVVDRSHRVVVRVTGEEDAVFLNNLLSQKLDGAKEGFSAGVLDLDVRGRVLHQADLTRTPSGFLLDLPAADAASLEEYLKAMVFWSKVDIDRADLAIVTVLGGKHTPASLGEALAGLHPEFIRRPAGWLGAPRIDVAVPSAELEAAIEALERAGLSLGGLMAYTAERVRALAPERHVDLDEKAIPHEVAHWIGRGDVASFVHLDKGCYRGQETVSRVENLGRAPRLLVLLNLDGSAPSLPTPGADLTVAGRRAGRLGTVVHDHELGPIALGLVKRSALDSGQQLAAGDVAAAVDPNSLPTETEEGAGRAAIERLRGRR